MSLTIEAALGTNIGHVRKRNEDSGYAGRWLFAVADGLGGHVAGDIASSTVIEALKPYDRQVVTEDLATTLSRAIFEANDSLYRRTTAEPSVAGMGTTLVAVLYSQNCGVFANIGDSRIYLLRDGRLFPISEDHVYGQLVSDAAAIPDLPAKLTRFLDGRADGRSPDLTIRELAAGDRLLLCSDGLSGVVDPREVHGILTSCSDPRETVDQLIETALARGGPDNITAIVANVQAG